MSEEQNKDRLMKIADNELRDLDKEQVSEFINWWGNWRTEVGWKRMSRILTTYAKEIKKKNYKKDELEDLEVDEDGFTKDLIE